ncbi:MaoC/PaaZ C-terminal domain-containing protein [Novosphingobium sp. JCM 18896]|uniref:MaoC/PaaZ C-terminal domain-containing protein n=1 Tax=Novosphingobium sp. JCM 18896 TaxID=2989731 RepID=UPI0022232A30|nr:MaoC/PaaZ C-terminal domain-containing protein [Novosphingobium sp. JCM 18896]MCW1429689.1 MaoC/PaaZ C-terminal domain-containing protein [Novosphingobium sp. JCM 18896]
MRYPEILELTSGPAELSYTEQDAIIYALGVGAGLDRLGEDALRLVYEKDLRVLPTFATTLLDGSGDLFGRAEIDFRKVVHSEQRLVVHRPLPPAGRVSSTSRVLGVADKGAEKGAVVYVEHTIADAAGGAPYATVVLTLYCRGDGGFGGPNQDPFPVHAIPQRAPDKESRQAVPANQAALYRYAIKDANPLHIDPAVAKAVGFEQPLLHGLCTYGFAARAIMADWCDDDPARIKSFDVRFAAPFFPGETLVTRSWRDGSVISFECEAAERGAVIFRNGRCEIGASEERI